jgi:hypothetical protein
MKRRGLVRLEVQASHRDAALIKQIASALRGDRDDSRAVRARLNRALAAESRPGLKALLAAAPLEGIDLARRRRPARAVAGQVERPPCS